MWRCWRRYELSSVSFLHLTVPGNHGDQIFRRREVLHQDPGEGPPAWCADTEEGLNDVWPGGFIFFGLKHVLFLLPPHKLQISQLGASSDKLWLTLWGCSYRCPDVLAFRTVSFLLSCFNVVVFVVIETQIFYLLKRVGGHVKRSNEGLLLPTGRKISNELWLIFSILYR